MTIQQYYPNSRPSLNLNFATSTKLDPVVTFSRTTSGTQINRNGFIESVPADTARFDHDPATLEPKGLVIEEGRTNFCTLSGDNYSFGSTININETEVFNPDGTPAIRRVPNATNNTVHGVDDHAANIDISEQADGTTTTLSTSIFLKNFNNSNLGVLIGWAAYDGTTYRYRLTTPNTASQSIGTPGDSNGWSNVSTKVEDYGNGWYRYTFTSTYTKQSGYHTIVHVGEQIYSSTYQQTWTGDGVSGIYIWGRQREIGPFSTSYIPTNGSEGVRAKDYARIEGDNFSKWFNPTEGTIHMRLSSLQGPTSGYNRFLMLTPAGQNSQNNSLQFIFSNSQKGTSYALWEGSTIRRGYNKNITGSSDKENVAFAYKSDGDTNVYIDGNAITNTITSNGYAQPTFGRMGIGSYPGGEGTAPKVIIESLSYYPTRLSNAILQTLTK